MWVDSVRWWMDKNDNQWEWDHDSWLAVQSVAEEVRRNQCLHVRSLGVLSFFGRLVDYPSSSQPDSDASDIQKQQQLIDAGWEWSDDGWVRSDGG